MQAKADIYVARQLHDRVFEWLSVRAGQRVVPGLSVSIIWHGQQIFEHAFGYADFAAQRRLTPQHTFLVGSQSKMLTAVTILRLVKDKRLALDDRVITYVPWLGMHNDTRMRHITIEQLLCHKAGLSREGGTADFWLGSAPFPDVERLQKLVLNTGLLYAPGSILKYSNLGYALLGQVVQSVTGQSFEYVVEELVIERLALKQTCYKPDTHLATGYTQHMMGQRHSVPQKHIGAYSPATGAVSTPHDMALLVHGIFGESQGILDAQSKALLTYGEGRHWRPASLQQDNYSMGMFKMQLGDVELVGHGGSMPGYRTCTYYMPAFDMTASIAANSSDAAVHTMLAGLVNYITFYMQDGSRPRAISDECAGLYSNDMGYIQLLQNAHETLSVDPSMWTPFDTIEHLTRVGDHEFVCSEDASFVGYRGEPVVIRRSPEEACLNYAGIPFQKTAFRTQCRDCKR